MGTTVSPRWAVLELAEGVEQRQTDYATLGDAIASARYFASMGYDCEVYRFMSHGPARMAGVVRRFSDTFQRNYTL